MIKQDCASWEEFVTEVNKISAHALGAQVLAISSVGPLLFRGQADSTWKLQTTLERHVDRPLSVHHYHNVMRRLRPHVQAFTGKDWDVPTREEFLHYLDGVNDTSLLLHNMPAYAFMAHLRHHGFPSPLLDWTTSPFVAAFFAFRRPPIGATAVAIYGYLDSIGGGRGGMVGDPEILTMGPFVKTHTRHFLQKSRYTLCVKWTGAEWTYEGYEDAFDSTTSVDWQADHAQDLLWKFTIPVSERAKVLEALEQYNLNAYSLLQTEEALLESLLEVAFSRD